MDPYGEMPELELARSGNARFAPVLGISGPDMIFPHCSVASNERGRSMETCSTRLSVLPRIPLIVTLPSLKSVSVQVFAPSTVVKMNNGGKDSNDTFISCRIQLLCITCIIYKRVMDDVEDRMTVQREKLSRAWSLLNKITWDVNGSSFADITYGGYTIICMGLLIGHLCSALTHPVRVMENFFLGLGTVMFVVAGSVVFASLDMVPPELVPHSAALGVLSLVTALLFLLDIGTGGGRRKAYLARVKKKQPPSKATQTDVGQIVYDATKSLDLLGHGQKFTSKQSSPEAEQRVANGRPSSPIHRLSNGNVSVAEGRPLNGHVGETNGLFLRMEQQQQRTENGNSFPSAHPQLTDRGLVSGANGENGQSLPSDGGKANGHIDRNLTNGYPSTKNKVPPPTSPKPKTDDSFFTQLRSSLKGKNRGPEETTYQRYPSNTPDLTQLNNGFQGHADHQPSGDLDQPRPEERRTPVQGIRKRREEERRDDSSEEEDDSDQEARNMVRVPTVTFLGRESYRDRLRPVHLLPMTPLTGDRPSTTEPSPSLLDRDRRRASGRRGTEEVDTPRGYSVVFPRGRSVEAPRDVTKELDRALSDREREKRLFESRRLVQKHFADEETHGRRHLPVALEVPEDITREVEEAFKEIDREILEAGKKSKKRSPDQVPQGGKHRDVDFPEELARQMEMAYAEIERKRLLLDSKGKSSPKKSPSDEEPQSGWYERVADLPEDITRQIEEEFEKRERAMFESKKGRTPHHKKQSPGSEDGLPKRHRTVEFATPSPESDHWRYDSRDANLSRSSSRLDERESPSTPLDPGGDLNFTNDTFFGHARTFNSVGRRAAQRTKGSGANRARPYFAGTCYTGPTTGPRRAPGRRRSLPRRHPRTRRSAPFRPRPPRPSRGRGGSSLLVRKESTGPPTVVRIGAREVDYEDEDVPGGGGSLTTQLLQKWFRQKHGKVSKMASNP
uniref:Uncharacterized protein n=1 Tax=Timema cristinae TaxID=61476 RepID=A0A7R9GY12_TIMCR|nr:unnamed protein product [Timema cristinae]